MQENDTETSGSYRARLVEPGENLILPGTSEDMECADTPVMVGQLESGDWLSWVPYYEDSEKEWRQEPMQAIAENKYVAAGAIQDYYWGERSLHAEN